MNKMDDTQKMAFLNAMRVKTKKGTTEPEETLEQEENPTRQSRRQQREKEVQTAAKPEELDLALDQLYDYLARLQSLRSKSYTLETWLPFHNAYSEALLVYQLPQPTKEQIQKVTVDLQKAEANLQKK